MTLMSRLSFVLFWGLVGGAILAEWDARAEQPSAFASQDSEVNRMRKWLGRSPRGMPGNQVGKNHDLVRKAFRESIREANESTVRVFSGKDQVSLGTIVRSDGYILTKASELKKPIYCKIPEQGRMKAKRLATSKSLDLALLRVEKRNLAAIAIDQLNDDMLAVGSWVATPSGAAEIPIVIGVISGGQRRIERDAPVIGVSIEDIGNGVLIRRVMPGSGAEAVGVEEGDIVTQIDDVIVSTANDLMRVVERSQPNATVRLKVRRAGQQLDFAPRLGRRTNLGMAEQGLLAHEGGPLSQRRSNFPLAIQHDCLIEPHQCGGPLVDVDGKVVGINIARAGRAVSYTLPLRTLRPAIRDLISLAESRN